MSQDGFKLKDGKYKIIDGFVPLVEVDGLSMKYKDFRDDSEKIKIIQYGKVMKNYI